MDRIPNEAWKNCEGKTRNKFQDLLGRVWRGKRFLNAWRRAIVSLLYKKGDVNIAASYRGISLLSMAYKIYAGIISDRLRKTGKKDPI